jgi:pyruvate formate lyase activating enzyme
VLAPGKLGICGVRGLRGGQVVALSYGQSTGLALDPIEKKPLACFHPGSRILSYGSFGCNMRCPFCQNSGISTARADAPPPAVPLPPEDLVAHALSLKAQGNIGIALTYNEPFVAWEYLMDSARCARRAGLLTAVVTNGYVAREAWEAALPLIDAANIDLKCYTEEGYEALGAPGGLGIVKGSIASAHAAGVHVEVTTLLVPGLSDDEDAFREECAWLAALDPGIPLHITRFFPCHQASDLQPTSIKLMRRFKQIADSHLARVYLGNV